MGDYSTGHLYSPGFKRAPRAAKLLREAVRADVLVELLEGVVEINALLKCFHIRKIHDIQFEDQTDLYPSSSGYNYSVLSPHLDTLLQERFEQVVGGLCQPECLDDVELSKPDGK